MNTQTSSPCALAVEPSHVALNTALNPSAPMSRIPADLQDLAERHAWASSLPDAVLLNNAEAALFMTACGFHTSPATLETWRCRRSDGPEFVRFGRRIAYEVAALRRYLRIQPSVAA